ncbi:pantetheine-phosphate adenylyltransferase [Jiella sonneratiae]|uniref:Phosphopantetheine adenylyltransferase n=1 Tax=Jiella sonneratiae TaxID=2816856 RepID=A0ABS3IYA2_9HYPH|nr:pantetheine-phosphate adenylyltransferase [Jiella sonneratiae]MBO0902382.1 pantetheine-phosphate adenylyltransferase [Jiella sonneratiae]
MPRRGFYPGSFDPLTNGHLSVLVQALAVFDEVVVGIGVHPGKQALFSFEERVAMIREAVAASAAPERVGVVSFDGLVVDAADAAGAVALIRGVRDGTDLDYEMQMAGMNGAMRPQVVTLFFPASPDTRPITATLVRQIAKMGGDVSRFVPAHVAAAIRGKRGPRQGMDTEGS